jgi:Icc-related predicted phosphoesterase
MSKEVKIVAISDLHGELNFSLPSANILTISGDICPCRGSHAPMAQMFWLKNTFFPWCDKLINKGIFNHIVFIPGNHDFVFTKVVKYMPDSPFNMELPKCVHYLCDSAITLEGIKIYGTPWTPVFCDWAYMREEYILDQIFAKIPKDLDILLVHGPAHGWNDTIIEYNGYEHLGSRMLYKHILRAMPKWVFCGHIHSGDHKVSKIPIDNGIFINSVNVSIVNEKYEVAYKPFETIIEKE